MEFEVRVLCCRWKFCTFLVRLSLFSVFSDKWSPALQIRTVLLSIQALLSAPNADDPLATDVADMWKSNEAEAIRIGERIMIWMMARSLPDFSFRYVDSDVDQSMPSTPRNDSPASLTRHLARGGFVRGAIIIDSPQLPIHAQAGENSRAGRRGTTGSTGGALVMVLTFYWYLCASHFQSSLGV